METIITPTPKYKIGDVVYHPTTSWQKKVHPCPDCLGTKRWKAITPGGLEMNIQCERCCGYSSCFESLEYWEHVPIINMVTISGLNTVREDGETIVQYYQDCQYWKESNLYATEDEALAAAQAIADNANAENTKAKMANEARTSGFFHLHIVDAMIDRAKSEAWEVKYAAGRFQEKVTDILDADYYDDAEKIAEIRKLTEDN